MSESCRLCGQHKPHNNTVNIYENPEFSVTSKIEICFKINLENASSLPNTACLDCIETLDKCCQFAQQILDVQERLKSHLQVTKEDPFELKIERLDEDEWNDFEKGKSGKVRSKRNRGVKMAREVARYSMGDLFKDELRDGVFTASVEDMEIDDKDKEANGTLSQNAYTNLHTLSWNTYDWKCQACSTIFTNVLDLERHSLKCAKRRCTNSCSSCIKDFPSYSTFINHVTERHEKSLKFSCIVCSEFRWNFVDLYRHIRSSHEEYNNIFFCLYCGKYYFTGALLRDHILSHRPSAVLPTFHCDLCHFTTHRKQSLLSHMSRFHLERRFTCEICAFSFKYRAEMVQHQSQHNDECNEECRFCGKFFKNKRKLRRHVRNIHEVSESVFSCEICGKCSKNRKGHVTHMKIHSDKDTFQCQYCPRTFKHSSGFTYHTRTHTGERPYMCPVDECDQKFIDWPNCQKHIRSSHGLSDIKPIQVKRNL